MQDIYDEVLSKDFHVPGDDCGSLRSRLEDSRARFQLWVATLDVVSNELSRHPAYISPRAVDALREVLVQLSLCLRECKYGAQLVAR